MKNLIKLNKIFALSFLFLTVNFAHSASPDIKLLEISNKIEEEVKEKLKSWVNTIRVERIEEDSNKYQVTAEINSSSIMNQAQNAIKAGMDRYTIEGTKTLKLLEILGKHKKVKILKLIDSESKKETEIEIDIKIEE